MKYQCELEGTAALTSFIEIQFLFIKMAVNSGRIGSELIAPIKKDKIRAKVFMYIFKLDV